MPAERDPDRADADRMVMAGKCPCCLGTGLEDGTGDACGGDGEGDTLACAYCNGEGCGGTCSWCGGTGRFSDWEPGNPSYEGIISDDLLPSAEVIKRAEEQS